MNELDMPATQAVTVSQPAHAHTNTPTVEPKKYRAVIGCGKTAFEKALYFQNDLEAAINMLGLVCFSNGAATNFELFREDGSKVCAVSPWAFLSQMAPLLSEVSKRSMFSLGVITLSEKKISNLFPQDTKDGGK